MTPAVRYWIPLGLTITALSGLVYLTGQQNLRQNANDPQIQISEDIATRLSANPNIPSLPTTNAVDISKSLGTYIIVFNDQGKPLFSNAKLDGKTPEVPQGVFAYTRKHEQDRITWEPKSEVRSAVVLTRYSGKSPGFVLVGRSLREVEEREEELTKHVGLAWVVTMLGTLLATIFFIPKAKKLIATKPASGGKK